MFDLSSPWWLLLLLAVIVVAAGYIWVQRQRRGRTLRFANLDLLDTVVSRPPSRLRHAPVAVLLVGLILLIIALAGPQADRQVPRNRATVILVVDVSQSMNATDVQPTRLIAAQQAGKRFAGELTSGINLGLISFAGYAVTLVSPTPDHAATQKALGTLRLDDRTATGEGIFAAIQQIQTLNSALGGNAQAPPARIVMLSDGKETVPDDPDDPRGAFTAARKARELKIPVSTISFGTASGVVDVDGEQIPVPVDDPSLRNIARLSGGDFFTAASLDELTKVYRTLQRQIGYETRRDDNYRPWLIAGTVLILLSTAGALVINQRLP